jgi:predicted lipoprotein with Yx(FWY)xxD motif
MKKLSISIAVVALALVGVTGCAPTASDYGTGSDTGSSGGDKGSYGNEDSGGSGGSADTTGIASLTTAESDLGTIVVDDTGMTVYVYDKDTQGSGQSSCTGQCLANWPPVTADQAPSLDGVTGDVDTITGTDGSTQVTLDGWPLYYYAGDSAAGDTAGQGVSDVWWVVGADGKKITGM